MGISVVKCRNGHWFDKNTYEVCPHCGAPTEDERSVDNSKSVKGLLRMKTGKSVKSNGRIINPNYKIPNEISSISTSCETVAMTAEHDGNIVKENCNNVIMEQTVAGTASISNERTVDIWQKINNNEKDNTVIEPDENIVIKEKNTGLSSEIKNASANNEGRTMGYFSSIGKSVGNNFKDSDNGHREYIPNQNPVVGWLVAVSGAHFGQSFCIESDKNSIGRSNENNIVLNMDNSVSRVKHAIVVYEPKKRNFYEASSVCVRNI